MHAEPQVGLKLAQAVEQRQWQAFAMVALCLIVPLAVFFPTFLEMVRIWTRSETFTHGWLVLPAFLYFVWRRRADLAATPLRPFFPALVLAAGAGFIWLLGQLSSSLTPSFFALIALIPLVVWAICGWGWVRELLFPLSFLFFAVPFGEVFVPQLMEWTADFTVLALQASGVPVLREGQHLMIPTGRWSVVEACSGIRYLIASMFVGALYAWIMYRSALRRSVFFAAAVVVPIVANWMRAYIIVMLGHLSDNRIAAGVDHLIYGWIFFGIVMMLLFWIGSLWREDVDVRQSGAVKQPIGAGGPRTDRGWARVGGAALSMLALLVALPIAEAVMLAPRDHTGFARVPIEPTAGWVPVEPAAIDWKPHLVNSASEQRFAFAKNGETVEVFIGLYRNQRQGAELVNSSNQLQPTRDLQGFMTLASGSRATSFAGHPLAVRTATIANREQSVVAWQWYWLGDGATSSDAWAKLELALDRLRGRDDTSAWLTVFVVDPQRRQDAHTVLGSFVSEMGGALDAALRQAVPK